MYETLLNFTILKKALTCDFANKGSFTLTEGKPETVTWTFSDFIVQNAPDNFVIIEVDLLKQTVNI